MHRSLSSGRPWRGFSFAVALVWLLSWSAACGGDSDDPVDPPRLTEATAERVVVDGAATLSSVISVRFNRSIEVSDNAPEDGVRLTLSETGGNGFEVPLVTVLEFAASRSSSRLLEVKTEGLVPDGTLITVDARVLDGGGVVAHEAEVRSDLTASDAILASSVLVPLIDTSGVPAEPILATAFDRDDAAVRILLEDHLLLRAGLGSEITGVVLDLYDAIPPDIVPHPKLRAALAALYGTFAQPAIGSLLTEQNCTGAPVALIDFQEPPSSPTLLAEVTHDDEGRRVVSINPITEGDRFEHLMPLLAHEAIHCDMANALEEEIAATAFDTYLYTVLLALDPTLADQNTPLARNLNVDATAMANSGRLVPESVGILQSFAVDRVLPEDTSPAQSFAEHVALAYSGLPAGADVPEPLAAEYVAQLVSLTDMAPGSAFDLEYLDTLMGTALPRLIFFEAVIALQLVPLEQ